MRIDEIAEWSELKSYGWTLHRLERSKSAFIQDILSAVAAEGLSPPKVHYSRYAFVRHVFKPGDRMLWDFRLTQKSPQVVPVEVHGYTPHGIVISFLNPRAQVVQTRKFGYSDLNRFTFAELSQKELRQRISAFRRLERQFNRYIERHGG